MAVGLRVGIAAGARVGIAAGISSDEIGAGAGLGVLIIGDSQVGRGNVADLTPRVDPAYNYAATQAKTYVSLFRSISNAVADPINHDVVETDVGVKPYVGTGSVTFSGPSTGIGQELTRMGISAVITEFADVGIACAQMVSPSFPSSGGQYLTQLIAYQRNVEATKGVQTKIIVVSAGNNDGLIAANSNNLCLPGAFNMKTLYDALVAAFPAAVICWIKINADTVNFPGFNTGGTDTIANQATGFAALPLVEQIWCDDQLPAIGIETDHAHLTPNGARVYGSRALYRALDRLGYARTRPAAAPIMIGDGYVTATDGTGAPTSDGNPIAFDRELLLTMDMVVGATFNAQPTPSGWTFHSSDTGNTGAGVGCRMLVYHRAIDEAMLAANHRNTAATSVALTAPSTRLFNKILTFRGPNAGSAPTIQQIVFAKVGGNTSSFAGPSITTGGPNRRVVIVTMGFISANLATTCTLTGLTGGTVDRNSVVITPGTAGCMVDIQSAIVPSATTINISNVATSRTITGPVVAAIELA